MVLTPVFSYVAAASRIIGCWRPPPRLCSLQPPPLLLPCCPLLATVPSCSPASPRQPPAHSPAGLPRREEEGRGEESREYVENNFGLPRPNLSPVRLKSTNDIMVGPTLFFLIAARLTEGRGWTFLDGSKLFPHLTHMHIYCGVTSYCKLMAYLVEE